MNSFWSDVSDMRDIQNKKQFSFPSDAYIHNRFLCFPYPPRVTRNIQSCQDDSDLPLTFGMIFCLISCGRHSVYGSCVFLVYKNRFIIHRNVNVILLKFSSPTYTEVECFKMTNAVSVKILFKWWQYCFNAIEIKLFCNMPTGYPKI